MLCGGSGSQATSLAPVTPRDAGRRAPLAPRDVNARTKSLPRDAMLGAFNTTSGIGGCAWRLLANASVHRVAMAHRYLHVMRPSRGITALASLPAPTI